MASADYAKALRAIIGGSDDLKYEAGQFDLSIDELAGLQRSLSHLDPSPASRRPPETPAAINDAETSSQGVSASLWAQIFAEAEETSSQEINGDAVERHGDEMDPESAQQDSTSVPVISKLDEHLLTLGPEIAPSIRSSVAERLLARERSDDAVAADLAEILGFENLDLVGELIAGRSPAGHALLEHDTKQQPYHQASSSTMPFDRHTTGAPSSGRLTASARPYVPAAQVRVQSAGEVAESKALRAANRRLQKSKQSGPSEQYQNLTPQQMEQIRQQELLDNANRPLFSSDAVATDSPKYPHVFASAASGNTLSVFGSKFALPAGTARSDHKEYEEVTIPPPRAIPMRSTERLIPINEMDPMCRGAFPSYKTLNRLQSVVYPLGYGSNENLLVCAPTGAGKTDVAMLTVLRAISQYSANVQSVDGKGFGISLNAFKIVYVAPMKALAAEVVRKFSKRLAYLGVKVRELTGDMQMTRQEIAETQMIVTTPEKWDVVTRKPTGEGELATKVKLLIIDEVHLLHEDRGAVIETIVARTLRLVESSQSLIRIVGLSATLPNYVDVADFLRVNRYQGLFYFDSSFRPVPLEQHFMGIKGKPGSPQARSNLDKAAFFKVEQLLHEGHQVMIFVHARKETVKSALSIREMCRAEGIEDLLLAGREDKEGLVSSFKRDMMTSRNKEMKELFESGLGIHHAGMLRSDRTLSERMFEAGITKVLCCTSTLAWGVNLPAYAVLIKGTEVYDSGLGKFTDLSILDVLQIFGRAGRPQYEDLGVGYILTPQDKLSHYVDAITSQHPIESKFDKGLIDSLNAECALGTVQSLSDGISWLSYTYLFTRMRKNPLAYGMSHDEIVDDPHIGAKRLSLMKTGSKALVACKMMEVEERTGKLTITDLGRIAARYYIPWRTIEIFNEKLRPNMTEADVLSVLSLATDFEQIIPRDAEEKELKKMLENAPCEVPGGIETSPGKVNILLQAYISRAYVEDFALASDTAYVAQNTGRIIRALFEISLSHRWSTTTAALMSMSKAVERRMWPFDHPLTQSSLTQDTLYNLQRWADDVEISTLADTVPEEVGKLIHLNERIGRAVCTAAKQFPRLSLDYRLKPIRHDQLRVIIDVERRFDWNERVHGSAEAFYIWLEGETSNEIQQWSRLLIHSTTKVVQINFILNVPDSKPAGISLRWISDGWIGAEDTIWASFDDLTMPSVPPTATRLLDLPLLPVQDALHMLPSETRNAYSSRFQAFNAIQTQAFHTAMHSQSNMLICAPTASGKSTMAEISIWRQLRQDPAARILVLVPQHRLLLQQATKFSERYPILRSRLASSPQELAREDRSMREEIVFALPQHALRLLLDQPTSPGLRRCKLIVAEDLHLLNPAYELLLSRLKDLSKEEMPRLVATSASLYDCTSLASWLNIPELGVLSFHADDRPVPLRLSTQSFDLAHSLALLKMMVKPAYDKAKTAVQSRSGPVILFVPSRSQCLTTAGDLVTRAASELNQEGFLGVSPEEVEPYLGQLSDARLYEPVLHGIGIFHDGLVSRDRSLMLELYRSGVIKVLVASRDSCWSLPVRAGLTIIMGARFVELTPSLTSAKVSAASDDLPQLNESLERRVVDYPMADLVRMLGIATDVSFSGGGGECFLLCQTEQADHLDQALRDGLTLESGLLEWDQTRSISRNAGTATVDINQVALFAVLHDIAKGNIKDVQDIVQILAQTYFFQRLAANPSYYDAEGLPSGPSKEGVANFLSQKADQIVALLSDCGLISTAPAQLDRQPELSATAIGKRAIKDFDDAAIAEFIGIRIIAKDQPLLAAAFCRPLVEASKTVAAERERAAIERNSELDAMLLGLRRHIPSEWLAAFRIPRPDRKSFKALDRQRRQQPELDKRAEDEGCAARKEEANATGITPLLPQSCTEGGTESGEAWEDIEWSLLAPRLLLAAFFASVPLFGNGGECDRLREWQALLVRDLFQRQRKKSPP